MVEPLSAPPPDTGGNARPDTVAWLRFIEDEDDFGLRACLFETSVEGEPLGFVFARARPEKPPEPGSVVGSRGETFLAAALFGACAAAPTLALCPSGEVPARGLGSGPPVCRVDPTPQGSWSPATAWIRSGPHPDPDAETVLSEIEKRDEPFEPLERAASALAEAFDDSQVRALSEIPGLTTVVVLPPRTAGAETPTASETAPSPGPGHDAARGLVARLWAILAAPPRSLLPNGMEWPGELMPFQRNGVLALLEMDRLLLSDDMGLGKTVQVVAALRILKARREVGSCLVAAPAGVLDQWRREISKWAPEMSAIVVRGSAENRAWQWRAAADITLASYDVLRSDAGLLPRLRRSNGPWDAVVLDEAQRIKNRNDTSVAVKGLPRLRSWALTGTPVENDEEELASIMEFVDHDGATPQRRYHPGPELLRRHREVQLRRRKSDVLDDLPPKLETRLTIDLHPDQQSSYDKAEDEGIVYLKSLGAEVGVQHVLELISRLKQICNFDPRTGASSKLADIGGRLEELTARGHKALVFSQYANATSGVAAAAEYLREFDPLVLTGETPMAERRALIDRFRTNGAHKVMVLSLRVGGLGLNLQEASYVFHLDRWWNPAVERQAEDRAHRIGQTVKVNAIKYTCAGTIEERIDLILQRKQELFDRLVDDVSLDLSARMSREELLGLFGLRQVER